MLPAQGTLQAAFSPWDDIEEIIKASIDQAQQQVYVQAYLLTNKKIAGALIAAKRRGADVRVLADARRHADVPSSRLAELASAGVGVWLETGYENAHNKIIIIDAVMPHATVITGSFNFTWTAKHRNAENVLVVRNNPSVAAKYQMNWLRHQKAALAFRK
ncbi:MAG: phospholipase D-like domain-containing protein [Burkholderiaceae bacterium]